MPPRRRSSVTAPSPARTTRSRRNPSEGFAELPTPSRKRSISSAVSTTASDAASTQDEMETPRPVLRTPSRSAASSARSLRRKFTIELPAQQAKENPSPQSKGISIVDEAEEVEGAVTPKAHSPRTPGTTGSSWGLSTIFSTVRRVLSPFPPSRLLTRTPPSSEVTPIRQQGELSKELVRIEEEDAPEVEEQTPTASHHTSRKRKGSFTEPQSTTHKRSKLTSSTNISTPSRQPARMQASRTPNRRSSRSVREQRSHTPLKADAVSSIPFVPHTFTVPDDMDTLEETSEIQKDTMLPIPRQKKDEDTPQRSVSSVITRTATPSPTQSRSTQTIDFDDELQFTRVSPSKQAAQSPEKRNVAEESRKRKRVKIDDLAYIPSRRPGQSGGTFALLDEFFDAEEDSVELDESQIAVLSERPVKKARTENIFEMAGTKEAPKKTPKIVPAAKATPVKFTSQNQTSLFTPQAKEQSTSKENQPPPPSAFVFGEPTQTTQNGTTAAESSGESRNDPATIDPFTTPNALERKRSEAEKYKPTKGSRLREMSRLSSTSTLLGSPSQMSVIHEDDSSTQAMNSHSSNFAAIDPSIPTPAPAFATNQPHTQKSTSASLDKSFEDEFVFAAPASLFDWGIFTEADLQWAKNNEPSKELVDEYRQILRDGAREYGWTAPLVA